MKSVLLVLNGVFLLIVVVMAALLMGFIPFAQSLYARPDWAGPKIEAAKSMGDLREFSGKVVEKFRASEDLHLGAWRIAFFINLVFGVVFIANLLLLRRL